MAKSVSLKFTQIIKYSSNLIVIVAGKVKYIYLDFNNSYGYSTTKFANLSSDACLQWFFNYIQTNYSDVELKQKWFDATFTSRSTYPRDFPVSLLSFKSKH